MKSIRTFTYVTYDRVQDHLDCGWMAVIPNAPHRQINAYGIVMEWRCGCKMVRPQ